MADLATIITAHPFWNGKAAALGERLAGAARLVTYAPGAVVFEENGPAQHLHLLTSGRVALESVVPVKGVTIFKMLDPGEAIGWSWLLPPHRWQFTARAVAPSEIVIIDAAAVRAVAEEQPEFGRELVNRMAEVLMTRLESTREKLKQVHSPAHARQVSEDEDEA